jgi:hypothetical protein
VFGDFSGTLPRAAKKLPVLYFREVPSRRWELIRRLFVKRVGGDQSSLPVMEMTVRSGH